MADITMCTGGSCPFKADCYRYTAPINALWQSYFAPPYDVKADTCQFFWPNNGEAS